MNRVAVITGASSGLGKEIAKALEFQGGWDIRNWSLDQGVDVSDYNKVFAASAKLPSTVDVLINCAGINKIDPLANVDPDDFRKVMQVNAQSIFNCTQALLDRLKGGTVLNIVSNAAHNPMSHSLAYNASKGAALMMTKQLARELMPSHDITVFSISPNKLRGTGMSKDIEEQVCRIREWTKQEAAAYQRNALITREETEVADLAEFIAFILSKKRRHKWFAGCDIPYGL